MEKSDILAVLCTFPDAEQARQIGTNLIEAQLAACVNLLPGVSSIYRWEGAVESATEVLAVFKTRAATWPRFEAALRDAHPYDVPEIIALDPAQISLPYARWVLDSVPDTDGDPA